MGDKEKISIGDPFLIIHGEKEEGRLVIEEPFEYTDSFEILIHLPDTFEKMEDYIKLQYDKNQYFILVSNTKIKEGKFKKDIVKNSEIYKVSGKLLIIKGDLHE